MPQVALWYSHFSIVRTFWGRQKHYLVSKITCNWEYFLTLNFSSLIVFGLFWVIGSPYLPLSARLFWTSGIYNYYVLIENYVLLSSPTIKKWLWMKNLLISPCRPAVWWQLQLCRSVSLLSQQATTRYSAWRADVTNNIFFYHSARCVWMSHDQCTRGFVSWWAYRSLFEKERK